MIALEAPRWLCRYCGFTSPLARYYWRCPRCSHPLDVDFTPRYEGVPQGKGRGLRGLANVLPLTPEVSLGEGGTPLVVVEAWGVRALLKLEYMNPTGSFKDRGTALSISLAKSLGFTGVVEDSSGNTGIAVAAYAAHAGLNATIVVPRTAPQGKKRIIQALGARLLEASSRHEAYEEAVRLSKTSFYVAHLWNPLYIEGAKTIAYEVYEQYGTPNTVIAPFGSGGLLLGLAKGFEELREMGYLDSTPKFIAVQGVSNPPLYEAFYGREAPKGDSSLADGIMVPKPPRLKEAVEVLRRCRGGVVLVDNSDIRRALKELCRRGFIVEPTSATVLAGLWRAFEQGLVDKGDTVLMPLTGSGLKTFDLM